MIRTSRDRSDGPSDIALLLTAVSLSTVFLIATSWLAEQAGGLAGGPRNAAEQASLNLLWTIHPPLYAHAHYAPRWFRRGGLTVAFADCAAWGFGLTIVARRILRPLRDGRTRRSATADFRAWPNPSFEESNGCPRESP